MSIDVLIEHSNFLIPIYTPRTTLQSYDFPRSHPIAVFRSISGFLDIFGPNSPVSLQKIIECNIHCAGRRNFLKTRKMFCSSLRGREDWTEVPAILLAIEFPKWKELTLTNCDLAMPFPSPENSTESSDLVRFILLSPKELANTSSVLARIQKFYHAYGSKNIAIMFPLNQHDPKENGSSALMRLQTNFLSEYEIPVVPLFGVESLEVTLMEFRQQLRVPPLSPRIIVSEIALLPYCSVHPPIPEHARNLLSDICPNIAGLQALVRTHEGMQKLAHILSDYPGLAQEIIDFWLDEHITE